MRIRNVRATCLEPSSDIPYVLHEVEYEEESLLREGLWVNNKYAVYASDPMDAIKIIRRKIWHDDQD